MTNQHYSHQDKISNITTYTQTTKHAPMLVYTYLHVAPYIILVIQSPQQGGRSHSATQSYQKHTGWSDLKQTWPTFLWRFHTQRKSHQSAAGVSDNALWWQCRIAEASNDHSYDKLSSWTSMVYPQAMWYLYRQSSLSQTGFIYLRARGSKTADVMTILDLHRV